MCKKYITQCTVLGSSVLLREGISNSYRASNVHHFHKLLVPLIETHSMPLIEGKNQEDWQFPLHCNAWNYRQENFILLIRVFPGDIIYLQPSCHHILSAVLQPNGTFPLTLMLLKKVSFLHKLNGKRFSMPYSMITLYSVIFLLLFVYLATKEIWPTKIWYRG